VGVEKGTKAVISADSSVYGGLEFNNLRSNFVAEIPEKSFSTATPVLNSYRPAPLECAICALMWIASESPVVRQLD